MKRMEEKQKSMATKFFYNRKALVLFSGYHTPELHQHLAVHLIVSPDNLAVCRFLKPSRPMPPTEKAAEPEGLVEVKAPVIFINTDVLHTAWQDAESTSQLAVFLFDSATDTACALCQMAENAPWWIPDEHICRQIQNIIRSCAGNPEEAYEELLKELNLPGNQITKADKRIKQALAQIEEMSEITTRTLDDLAAAACLSKSRFSHLFYENTGISPGRYLVLEKMRKCIQYMQENESITQAAIKAGFSSSSHFSAACRRMFGISMSDFLSSTRDSQYLKAENTS